jgi:hypothetical protein
VLAAAERDGVVASTGTREPKTPLCGDVVPPGRKAFSNEFLTCTMNLSGPPTILSQFFALTHLLCRSLFARTRDAAKALLMRRRV